MEKTGEKTVEIMCNEENQYLIEAEDGPKLKKDPTEIADEICSYKFPVHLIIRSHYISKSDRYFIEKITEQHNSLYYAKKSIEELIKKLESSE